VRANFPCARPSLSRLAFAAGLLSSALTLLLAPCAPATLFYSIDGNPATIDPTDGTLTDSGVDYLWTTKPALTNGMTLPWISSSLSFTTNSKAIGMAINQSWPADTNNLTKSYYRICSGEWTQAPQVATPNTRYCGFAFYFDPAYTLNNGPEEPYGVGLWQAWQGSGWPPCQLRTDESAGNLRLRFVCCNDLCRGSSNQYSAFVYLKDASGQDLVLNQGQWYKIIIQMAFDYSGSNALVRCWVNGSAATAVNWTGKMGYTPESAGGQSGTIDGCDVHFGIYCNQTTATRAMDFDEIKLADTQTEADPSPPPVSPTNITLTASDAYGFSSFTPNGGATNWSNGRPPTNGCAYLTASYTLRTPTNNSALNPGDIAFGGDSLELDTGGILGIKSTNRIVVNNLILNGGTLQNSSVTAGTPVGTADLAVLKGNINVQAASFLSGGTSNGVTTLNLLAPMAGSGAVMIQNYGTVMFSAANTYAGATTIGANSTLKLGATNALPNGLGTGGLTLQGGASGATLDLNGFPTTVNGLAGGSGAVLAQVFNSAAGTTATLTVGAGDTTSSFGGLIQDNPGTGGTVALAKTGTGIFTVFTNTYSGDTTISAGTLQMGAGAILPTGAGKGNLIVNGTLDLAGQSETINGLSGGGTVDNVTGAAASTLTVGNNDVSSTFSGVIQNTVQSTALTKMGLGTLYLTGNSSFSGAAAVKTGAVWIASSSALGSGTKTITIQRYTTGGELHLNGTNGNLSLPSTLSFVTGNSHAPGALVNEAGDNSIHGTIALSTGGSTLVSVNAGSLTLAGNISIAANQSSRTLSLGGPANGTVSGAIADGPNGTNFLSLTKVDAGAWTLSGANTYTGTTAINGGTLVVNGVIGAGALTVATAATLAGTGRLTGPVTVSAGGILSPGSGSSLGVLTISNTLTLAGTNLMKLIKTGATLAGDKLVGMTSNTCGGTLQIAATGNPLAAGDSIQLYSAAHYAGSFATILPATPGANLAWDTNTLATDGTLRVKSTLLPSPVINQVALKGGNIIVSGANGLGNGTYYVLSSTNLTLPLANWMPVLTNTFGTTGAFSNNIPVNPAGPRSFYILRQ